MSPTVTDSPLAIGIHGAAGRMGARLIALAAADPALRLVAALDRAGHPRIGEDIGPFHGLAPLGVPLSDRIDGEIGAIIDFSGPEATLSLAKACAERGIPLVVGTTGFSAEQDAKLGELARVVPLLVSPNMSRAVNLTMRLAEQAARLLGDTADIEVMERHHNQKKDAPSGTAVRIVDLIRAATGIDRVVPGRHGITGARPRDEIGVHALRCGDNPGEHTVVFGMPGEVIEITHRAYNRDGFASGALDAAKWLVKQPPGRYGMSDVLGL